MARIVIPAKDWAKVLGEVLMHADDDTIIIVDSVAKRDLALIAIRRLGKKVQIEIATENQWWETDHGKKLMAAAFEAAELPEVDETDLEIGTYTNLQLAEKSGSPEKLLMLLMRLPREINSASRRSIMSFAVEMWEGEGDAKRSI